MNSVVLMVLGLAVVYIGYNIYSKYVDSKIIEADPKRATPAKMYTDGVDFFPTSRFVLFGFQFKSIAGMAPVVGAIIALQWGWLPAVLWLFGGVLFIGWVHDYGSSMISVRNEGQTFGGLSYRFVSPRARLILLMFIYIYLLTVVGAFGFFLTALFSNIGSVAVGILGLVIAGLIAGQLIYRQKMDIMMVSGAMVVLAVIAIWLGTKIPITLDKVVWIILILAFCYFAAVLPIWRWAQPINYIGFYIIFLGIIGAAIGVLVGHPTLYVPSYTSFTVKIGPLWPMLMVTIACGAISGWHSLVGSSGTSRQLQNELDNRPVTAGSMFSEMILGLLALIIAASTFESFDAFKALLGKSVLSVYAVGTGNVLSYIGIPKDFGTAWGAAILVVLGITVMGLVVRFMRVATAELAGEKIPILKNAHVATLLALILGFILIYTGTWSYLWLTFGGANQLMASLALLMITIWLVSEKRQYAWTMYPMIFMYVTTIAALLYLARGIFTNVTTGAVTGATMYGQLIALAIELLLVVAALILGYDGWNSFKAFKAGKKKVKPAAA
ncbi:MAG: carbon starvation protein A [Candidatus Methanofastidiosia archaeon]